MKKILAAFLCVLMCASLTPMALAANSRDIGFEAALASQLRELGLFLGVGDNCDGTPNFDLNRKPSRVEAVTMLVRAIGKGAEAEVYPKTHPFVDVPAWADGYVSYAYDSGLTKGESDTLFAAESTASAEMYLTFILRALGYSDGDEGDFTWDAPWALGALCGILPAQVDITEFLRADVVDVTCATLFACIKGTQTTLYERLVSEDVFTKEQFKAIFPSDPFEDFRLVDEKIAEVVDTHKRLGLLDNNVYATECHIIMDIAETNDVITVSALVCYGNAALSEDYNTITDFEETIDLWLIKMDPNTLESISCRTAEEMAADGLYLEECFSEKTLTTWELLVAGMANVCKMETQRQIDSGLLGRRQRYSGYEIALAEATASVSTVIQALEADSCTILLGTLGGTPHGSSACLYLIYKKGSAVGEGVTVSLPLPQENFIGLRLEPDDLRLSEDGLTLNYSYHYDEPLVIDEGLPSERVAHEAGTYSYIVNLYNGVTSLKYLF